MTAFSEHQRVLDCQQTSDRRQRLAMFSQPEVSGKLLCMTALAQDSLYGMPVC